MPRELKQSLRLVCFDKTIRGGSLSQKIYVHDTFSHTFGGTQLALRDQEIRLDEENLHRYMGDFGAVFDSYAFFLWPAAVEVYRDHGLSPEG